MKTEFFLLKEDQFKSLAVIGPNAAEALTGGGGSSKVSPIFSVSPLAALQKRLGDKVRINYAKGVDLEGGAAPIPPSSLFDPDKKYNGLKGEYFSNPDLKGEPAFVRTDQKLDFNWGDGSPMEGFNKDYFSVRWTGFIQPPVSGKYIIDLITDDGVRLYFEDKLVINDWTDHAAMTNSYTVKLEGGKKYKIKIEYYEHGGGAIAKLSWRKPGEDPLGAAVKAASESDAAIIFAGTTDQYETEGKDRKDLVLPGKQDKLIQAVSKVNKNVIVVLTTGSPVLMDSWIGNVKGILETWFAGEEIGNAAVDVLFGDYNPSGKLPVTFPHKWEDCSAYGSYMAKNGETDYSDGIFVGYRHFDKKNIEPLFPFGYGLSYTKFVYSNLKIEGTGDSYKLSFDIKNTGKVKGAEAAQVYVAAENAGVDNPVKQLKGFGRVTLKPGENKMVAVSLPADSFSSYDESKHEWVVNPGKYDVLVGASSRDIKLKGSVTVP